MGLINYTFFSQVLKEQVNVSVVLPTYSRRNTKEPIEEFYKKGTFGYLELLIGWDCL